MLIHNNLVTISFHTFALTVVKLKVPLGILRRYTVSCEMGSILLTCKFYP